MKILLVGGNSFLAKEAYLYLSHYFTVKVVSHNNVQDDAVVWSDVVVNFAIHPHFFRHKYDTSINYELTILPIIKKYNKRYVFLSSRKVYSNYTDVPHKESDICTPESNYGENKLLTEQILVEQLAEKTLILRMSNVVGFELIGGRNTMMGFLLNTLFKSEDINIHTRYDTIKDFLPVPMFGEVLVKLIQGKHQGLFNVGSGIEIGIGEVIETIVTAYGKDLNISYADDNIEPFSMDISKLKKHIQFEVTKQDLFDYFDLLGRKLKLIHHE